MELNFDTIYKVVSFVAAVVTIIRGIQKPIQHGE